MMRRYTHMLFAGACFFCIAGVGFSQPAASSAAAARKDIPEDVVIPAKDRAEALDKASALLKRQAVPALAVLENMPNPFLARVAEQSSAAPQVSGKTPGAQAAGVAQARTMTDAELLSRLSAALNPTGSFVRDGKPLLLFRERRVRVGDLLTVKYDGRDHVLKVTEITSNSFTLVYKNETLTRSIK